MFISHQLVTSYLATHMNFTKPEENLEKPTLHVISDHKYTDGHQSKNQSNVALLNFGDKCQNQMPKHF
jgi:hypothetical protein